MVALVSVDVESDGPVPGLYSLVSFGAVIVSDQTKSFYGQVKPISKQWIPEALAVSGFSREEHETFDEPVDVFNNFKKWLEENIDGRPVFISDNLAYDWQFINYYFHAYIGSNPFGFSGRRIGDIYSGYTRQIRTPKWKFLRNTKHTHNPVDDAKGNAEAIAKIISMMKQAK